MIANECRMEIVKILRTSFEGNDRMTSRVCLLFLLFTLFFIYETVFMVPRDRYEQISRDLCNRLLIYINFSTIV